jgi:hypothetical protein
MTPLPARRVAKAFGSQTGILSGPAAFSLLGESIMRKVVFAALAIIAAVACASSKRATIILPDLDIREVVGPSDMGYPRGIIEVQYEMVIANKSQEPLTLRRIEIQSVGSGGYFLRRGEIQRFNKTIAPGHYDTVTFWVRALSRGDTLGGNEPVTVRGVAYFDSPVGPTQKFFLKNISQFQGHD